MSPCCVVGDAQREAVSPSGSSTRRRTTRVWSTPSTRAISSASTQCADVAWYSNRVPGSQLRRHFANAPRRPSRVDHCGGPSGACGKPDVCSSTCSSVTASLPFSPNSGMCSAMRSSRASEPSASSCQTVDGHDRLRAREDDVAGVVAGDGVAERDRLDDLTVLGHAPAGTTGTMPSSTSRSGSFDQGGIGIPVDHRCDTRAARKEGARWSD